MIFFTRKLKVPKPYLICRIERLKLDPNKSLSVYMIHMRYIVHIIMKEDLVTNVTVCIH